MKATGFIKEIDDLGRIVIPKSVRKAIGVNAGDSLQLFLEDGAVVLKKLSTECVFCGSDASLREFGGKHVCADCIAKLSV